MGIFNLFGKKSASPRTDIIWMTSKAMLNGCIKFLTENKPDMYIAWFEDTAEKFNRFLNEENNMNITIKIATSLQPYHLDNKKILILEHYPLYSKEDYLLTGNKPLKIYFINSLDDTIFQIFGGNIAQVMKSMGLEENDSIENSLLSKSIVNAQKRLEKKVPDDFYARTGEEWLYNYRTYFQQNIQ